jgi:predicted phosphodiesterase
MSTAATRTQKGKDPLRFAHPFYTSVPPPARKPTPHGQRMLDHIQGTLNPIPAVKGTATMTLADIVGKNSANDIERSGTIRFHSTGDTGKRADSPQGEVAAAMASDFDIQQPETTPAFFLHLGDVIYGHTKDASYRQEFYEPYMHYPGKIVAIPGNHDGETIPRTDPETLRAFRANFCAPTQKVPAIAGSIFRETMTQPGAYWFLDAPFVDIIGLYSNTAENPGFISGDVPGAAQKKWLVKILQSIAKARRSGKRKLMIIATHHPPFSSAGHSGSAEMLADIDDACRTARVMPDLFLSGHSHTYQRYTRRVTFEGRLLEIPFIVCGVGGFNAQPIAPARGEVSGDHTFVHAHAGYGYLLVQATKSTVSVKAIGVDGQKKTQFDTVTVNVVGA